MVDIGKLTFALIVQEFFSLQMKSNPTNEAISAFKWLFFLEFWWPTLCASLPGWFSGAWRQTVAAPRLLHGGIKTERAVTPFNLPEKVGKIGLSYIIWLHATAARKVTRLVQQHTKTLSKPHKKNKFRRPSGVHSNLSAVITTFSVRRASSFHVFLFSEENSQATNLFRARSASAAVSLFCVRLRPNFFLISSLWVISLTHIQ